MGTQWKNTVRKVADGDAVNANNTNASVADLEQRTNYLKEQQDNSTSYSYSVLNNAPLNSETDIGDVAYFETSANLFNKALAKWSGSYDDNGELIEAESAQVSGIIIGKDDDTTGTLLTDGVYVGSDSFITKLFGTATPAEGVYFLSGTTAGSVEQTSAPLPLRILRYYGNNTIFVERDALPTHSHVHKSFTLSGSWLAITDTQFDYMTVPASAQTGYDLDGDPSVEELFISYSGTAVVTVDGVIQDDTQFEVNEDNIWYKQAGTPSGTVVVYATVPISYGQPLIRALQNTDEELEISVENGIATVNNKTWAEYSAAYEQYIPTAVAELLPGRKYKLTNVITDVRAGEGASVTKDSKGRVIVALSTEVEKRLKPDTINFNNAMYSTDGDIPYITFPEDRESSVIGEIQLGNLATGFTHEAVVFVDAYGIDGGGTFPALTVDMTFVPDAEAAAVDVSTATTLSTSIASFTSVNGYKYYKVAAAGLAVTAKGALYVKITAATSSDNKRLFTFGAVVSGTPV